MHSWLSRFRRPRPTPGPFLELVLSQSVLWCTVVLIIAGSSATLGFSLIPKEDVDPTEYDDPKEYADAKEDADNRFNQPLLTLLWQVLLQLLSSYCTVVPVLKSKGKIEVNRVMFHLSIGISVLTAVSAPIVYSVEGGSQASHVASTILNFTSAILATVAATQLAAGITDGLWTLNDRRQGV